MIFARAAVFRPLPALAGLVIDECRRPVRVPDCVVENIREYLLQVSRIAPHDGRAHAAVRDRMLPRIWRLIAPRHAIEGGLTRAQITEAFTHLGFYAGLQTSPNSTSSVNVARLGASFC